MQGFKKLFLSTLPASLLAFYLLPYVICSSNENHLIIPHKYIKHDIDNHKMSPPSIFEIKMHGILLWVSMGFLMPLGVLIVRLFNKEDCSPRKLKAVIYLHAILQIVAVLLAFVGAIMSITSFENSFNNTHQKIGLALYAAILMQTLAGFCRPKRGAKGRTLWYVFHWILGTAISLVGILNTYTGLKAYHKRTSMNTRIWSVLFTVEVSIMAFLYLFQEKWGYMNKQGVTSTDEPPIIVVDSHQMDNQKEVLPPRPSKESNTLGNYFAKNNALKKLFQVT